MKNLLIAASVAVTCAVSAIADNVSGANVFGLLTVEGSSSDTIVAVPWCECSTVDNRPIAISNMVKTANLTEGDKLAALSTNGVYLNIWTLTRGAGDVLYWQTQKMIVESGVVTQDEIPADKTVVSRGTAILLHRQNPATGGGKFYLYGQVGTNSTVTSTIENTGASATTPVYTLIAPPTSGDADFVTAIGDTAVPGDSVIVRSLAGLSRTFTYDDGAWKYRAIPYEPTLTPTNSIVIKAGTGAWYVSRNSSRKPTITWSGVPKK